VKSGKSVLSVVEKKVEELIKRKKVSWYEYRVPEEITKDSTGG
jgi:predicted Holliday junction resolvase-like endonuclease